LAFLRAADPGLAASVIFAGAALALAAPWPRTSWLAAVIATFSACLFAVDFAVRTMFARSFLGLGTDAGATSVGGALAVVLAALVACLAFLVAIAGVNWLPRVSRPVAPFAIALALVASGAWIGALLAPDLVVLFVAVEAAWLASVGLVGLSGDVRRGALNGALSMLVAGGVGAALFLLGAALLGHGAGSYVLAALPGAHVDAPNVAVLGAALILVALLIKAGLAPFGLWAAAAAGRLDGLPLLIVGVVGATSAVGVIARVSAFVILAPRIGDSVSMLLAAFGVVSVVLGSVRAMGARDLRRLAVHAWTAQAGIVLLCLALGSRAGLAAALVQIAAMSAMALALLAGFCAGLDRTFSYSALDGLARRAPFASAAIAAGALGLMGAPLTLGFLGRWKLVEAGVGAGWWWAAVAVIVVSLAGVFCGGQLIERMYFRRAEVAAAPAGGWRWMYAPALAAAIAATVFGLAPGMLLRAAEIAAVQNFGGTQ
jgi:multicomponent Na+:H+ antiporter subunit D